MKPRAKKRTAAKKKEKSKKTLIIVFGIFMIFLMVFSIVGVINSGPGGTNQLKYGDVEFELENRPNGGSVLIAELAGKDVEFQNLPTQVGFVEIDPLAITTIKAAQRVALVADPSLFLEDLSMIDYARLQLTIAIPKFYSAMSGENQYGLPVVNCSDASFEQPVIIFNSTNETTGLTVDGYCLTLYGEQQNLMRVKDRIIFEYHGILENGEVVE